MEREPIDRPRRKWLRGVAAAPAIFTLPTSATPLAVASNTCLKNPAAATATGMTGAPDGYVRIRLPIFRVKVGNTRMDAVQVGNKWYVYPSGGVIALPEDPKPTNPPRFAYGLVDYSNPSSTGKHRFYPEVQPTTPVAGHSCWNSVSPYVKVGTDNIYR